jgi:hypothetical protein
MSIYFKLILIYSTIIIKAQCESLNGGYTHPLKMHIDPANLNLSNQNDKKLLMYIEEQSKILSTMINTIGGNEVVVNPNLISKQCNKRLNSTKGIYAVDMVVLPFIEKFNGKNKFKVKICQDNLEKKVYPSLSMIQINSFDIDNLTQTENQIYLLKLDILKHLTNCLGLSLKYMQNKRRPKNVFFETPEYLLANSNSYKSVKKLYKLSKKELPRTDIHLNGGFYTISWDNKTIIKDFLSNDIDIENDMSETSFHLFNDMNYYRVSKCDLDYDDYGNCHRVDQRCISSDEFDNKYYLRYGISNSKIICYYSDENNIERDQCGNKYGHLLNDIINYSPLIKKEKISGVKIGDYEIPELDDFDEQELILMSPSEKCPKKMPRTVHFEIFSDFLNEEEIKNISYIDNITLKIVNITDRKYFVSFQMYEEKYIRLNFLKLLYLNGLYRSYVQLGNHNLFIAAFPYFILRERGKNHRINKYQKIFNHIGCEFFSNKDLLHTIYKSQKELFPNDYNFMKETYLYPEDKEIILKKFGNYKINKNNLWIVKPKNGNTGKGVHLFKNLEEESNDFLISKYITNPHLINGKKYDLRIYVLVTGLRPLKIYIYKEGLARISAEKFSLNEKDYDNVFVHLTNTGVNKKSKNYVYAKDFNSENANKLSLHTYQKYLSKEKANYDLLWEKIKDIAIKTIIAGHKNLIEKLDEFNLNDQSFFNLYGYDIIIDDKYEPYLLEVNRRPDMYIFDKMDKIVKEKIFVDTLNIVGIVPFSHDNKSEPFDEVYQYEDKVEEAVDYSYCELTRPRGDFELIFPLKDNIDIYKKYFRVNLPENEKFWEKIKIEEDLI